MDKNFTAILLLVLLPLPMIEENIFYYVVQTNEVNNPLSPTDPPSNQVFVTTTASGTQSSLATSSVIPYSVQSVSLGVPAPEEFNYIENIKVLIPTQIRMK